MIWSMCMKEADWKKVRHSTLTVRGLTRGRMLITEFCAALLQSDKSDLYNQIRE